MGDILLWGIFAVIIIILFSPSIVAKNLYLAIINLILVIGIILVGGITYLLWLCLLVVAIWYRNVK